jgi:Domain of unknown function (DUF5801)
MAIIRPEDDLLLDASALYMADSLTTSAAPVSQVAAVEAAALLVSTNENVVIDESPGLQNPALAGGAARDLDDDDIAAAALPSAFAARLGTLGAGTAINAAVSGHTGAAGNLGSDAFTFSTGTNTTTTDVRFTGAGGAALNGLDSGLNTLAGTDILLYTDSDNNILLGRAGGPAGAIVFAAYIDQTATGGKIWMVQYLALQNTNTADFDDSLNLGGKVFVGVDQDTTFSLAGAPSGQNLFLMYTTAGAQADAGGRLPGVTIVATGKDPANQSNGQNITTGDTINTSQAGGPTTFGTNSQMITEQEGIRFTFVTGARANVTIPNLDQNEADVESNIDFTGVFNARSAAFDVVQLQSGKSAQVRITALTTAAESGAAFIDGYAGDGSAPISNVIVRNTATGAVIENSNGTVNSATISISISGNVATLTGITAGMTIEYTTSADHQRVLIENGAAVNASGQTHADFDIGGFRLLQSLTTTIGVGAQMQFEDDGPKITVAQNGLPDQLLVDETFLAVDATANYADNYTSTPQAGTDGAGAAGTSTYALNVSAAGAESGLIDVATGDRVLLRVSGGVVEGYTENNGNQIVFTVSVSSGGTVTLDQVRALRHPDASNTNDTVTLAAASLVTLTRTDTINDGDGDSNSGAATINIGQALVFRDDGPAVQLASQDQDVAPLVVDESALGTDATTNLGPLSNFFVASPPQPGNDGASVSSVYTLAFATFNGTATGLVDVATNAAVLLYSVDSDTVEGRTAAGDVVFRVELNTATGAVTLDQIRALTHPDAANADDDVQATLENLITVTRTDTITDNDGDQATAQVTTSVSQDVVFGDDGPSITVADTVPPDALTVDESDLLTNASADFADNFTSTPSYGADGAGSVSSAFALSVSANGADSGLDDVATGQNVLLYLETGQVVGRAGSAAGAIVFTVSVNAAGTVALDQQRAVMHPANPNPDDSVTLASADLVRLTRTDTITDRDGDTSTGSDFLDIGRALNFEDDGPSISVSTTGTPPSLTVDETALAGNASASFAANFTNAPTFGADNAPAGGGVSSAFTLGVSLAGVASGLVDTASNQSVLLRVNASGAVEGYTAGSNLLVFTVSVNAGGNVTLDQIRAVKHPVVTDPDDSVTLASAGLVTLTRTDTITDRDGDSNTGAATLNIGQLLNFEDDGPALSFGNLVGSGTTVAQTGYWTRAGGADAVANLDLALNSVTLVRPDGSIVAASGTLNEGSPSPNAAGTYVFTGQLNGDFDNNGGTPNTAVDFTLDVFANGSYELDLVQGFPPSLTTLSSANGSLDSGGPDPVRTLTIGTEDVVFFAANPVAPAGTPSGTPPTAPAGSILAGVGIGAPDPTETDLQTNPLPSFIGNFQMNVSTAGIGVKNNVFQGDTSEAITAADESFVVNPETLMNSVKVFIDNSVAGYSVATETLYYRVFYNDGTSSALVDVNGSAAAPLTAEAGGQVSFTINTQPGLLIDAVQLIMARGEIKIPVIEFNRITDTLASDVQLAFTATLTDGDGDTAVSAFAANLFANELSPTVDFVLPGEAGQADAFNIDLASSADAWRIEGYQSGGVNGDKIALVGSGSFAVDNSGTDSIITITESGGQITLVTVVGVDVNNADVAFVAP